MKKLNRQKIKYLFKGNFSFVLSYGVEQLTEIIEFVIRFAVFQLKNRKLRILLLVNDLPDCLLADNVRSLPYCHPSNRFHSSTILERFCGY